MWAPTAAMCMYVKAINFDKSILAASSMPIIFLVMAVKKHVGLIKYCPHMFACIHHDIIK